MKKKNVKLVGITLILLFTFNIVNEILYNSEIPATKYENSNKTLNFEKTDEEIFNEENFIENHLKTSNSYDSNLTFSFDTQIDEIANQSWSYVNYNITNGGLSFGSGTNPMLQNAYNGSNALFEFYITELINSSSPTNDILRPNDISPMRYVSLTNSPPGISWEDFTINDDGPGNGNCNGYVHLNDTLPFGLSSLTYTPDDFTNITYNATLYLINAISNKTIKTTFKPTFENTQSDFIEWELLFKNKYFYNFYGQWQTLPDEYKAKIKLNDTFTISTALGKSGEYWNPLNYDRNSTHLTIYGSYEAYKINFYSPNLISATFNDNLTIPNVLSHIGKNELHLNVTCKMDGNLTISFTDSNGTTIVEPYNNVKKNEIISFNYIMLNYSRGGVGFLNISLLNGSAVYFGVKMAEIAFHKRAQIIGFMDNTTAFEPNFYLGAVLLDWDYVNYLASQGHTLQNDVLYVFNKTMIPNAKVSYNLIQYSGELPYVRHPVPAFDLWLYLLSIDLRELQIRPDEYNITFRSNKLGYENSEYVVKPFIVSKRPALVEIVVSDTNLEIEENFTLTVNLKINYTYFYENYLRIPAYVNLTFINNETGEVDGPKTYPHEIVQSFSINSQVSNDTIPGIHIVNVTLVSDYYQGSNSFIANLVKKPLLLTLDYDEDDFIEDEEFEVNWALQSGQFAGNHENMTLEIYLDGKLDSIINLDSGSSGITKFELDKGDYTLTYRIVSPFYTAETSVKIEVEEEEEKKPSWLEQNWLWLVIGVILLIAFAIFATFMVISRHKIKVKRGLESELITLKNRISSTEEAINTIETQIAEIASIFWILVVHSEQGTTMVEIDKFYYEKILGEDQLDLIGKGELKDSALIGGFLTAIRNFSRETSGTSMASQPIFNSQTDYSTVVDNMEIHRRILEGSNYFMAFISTKPTSAISEVLSGINTLFEVNYGETAKKFVGSVMEFIRFKDEVPKYLHEEIRKLQKELKDQQMLLEHYGKHLNQVQDMIGIKPKKIN